MKRIALPILPALFAAIAFAGGTAAPQEGGECAVTTPAPGWAFTEDEAPSFVAAAPEQQAGKSKLPQSWRLPYRHARDSRGGGVQIDLLIQTERSAYLVEIKRQNRIGREIEDEVETKMRRLPVRRGVSIHPVLVHLGEVSGEVDGDGFFDAIIPAESLLQSC